mmetsp:Transcript_44990/g.91839  ORF Transcript_44990/g.91839 Transcript_44990/m.91839 type:complete len:142 (+) Transcript_44990:1930-2355(+)
MLERQKVRKQAAEDAQRERAERLEKKGRQRVEQTQEILNLQDLWEADEIEDRLANMARAPEKLAAMKAQWKHCQEWFKKVKIKFPFSTQPTGSAVATWAAGLETLLRKDETSDVRKLRAEQMESVNDTSTVLMKKNRMRRK